MQTIVLYFGKTKVLIDNFVIEPDLYTSGKNIYITATGDDVVSIYNIVHDYIGMKKDISIVVNGKKIVSGYFGVKRVHIMKDSFTNKPLLFLHLV